jgi:hypothetical protein
MGKAQDYFCGRIIGNRERQVFHREIGEFGEETSDRRTEGTPAWLSLPGLPVLPVRKKHLDQSVYRTAYAPRDRCVRVDKNTPRLYDVDVP